MNVAEGDTIVQSTKVAQRLFEGSMLVITAHDSTLHRFNEVGTFIWQFIQTPKKISEITDAVRDNFDRVDRTLLPEHIACFIAALKEKQLISVYPLSANSCTVQ
ncbi:MAG: PqqD family protein [Chitinivibrionales bacterium]|nr:PqqD family protein [Chitinivibrionales bacterium]